MQVTYAEAAVNRRATTIGIHCTDGIIMGVEKVKISKMLCEGTNRQLFTVDRHAAVGVGGLVPDGRQIVNRAQHEANSYLKQYGEIISPEVLTERVAMYVHYFTLHGYLRPFGATAIISAYDTRKKQCQLSMVEPSGEAYRYKACATGKGKAAAKTEIEKHKIFDMTCREAIPYLVKILRMLGDDDKDHELEICWLCEETGYQNKMVPKDITEEALTWAVEQLKEEDDDEDDSDEDDDDDEGAQ
jgi:20S proteasome subunit alpha 7